MMLSELKENPLKQFLTNIRIGSSLKEHWRYLTRNNLELVDCQLVRVYPKDEGNFTLLYELDLKSSGQIFKKQIFAEWQGKQAFERMRSLITQLQKTKRSQLEKNARPDGKVCCLPDQGLVIRCLGLDEKINSLGLLQKPELLVEVLEKRLDVNAASIINPDAEILGHRLGKRCIARIGFNQLHDDAHSEKSLFIKLYKNHSSTALHTHQLTQRLYGQGFSNQFPITIAQPLGFDKQFNMVLMENAAGRMLLDMQQSAYAQMLHRSGQAIAKLHRTSIKIEKNFTVDDEIKILNHWVPLAASIFPELTDSLFEALGIVNDQLEKNGDENPVLVHRDFYDKQILFTQDKTTLIDFDTACMADPAIDIGNFIAHLQLLDLQGVQLPADAIRCFIDGYDAPRTSNWNQRVSVYQRSTLLRLVCIYLFWPRYKHLPEKLLNLFFES
ncbi:MAG: phosphotransferase family protein [Gammaproteobacteria bacterium]